MRGKSLPTWAANLQPLDMWGAAQVLGISKRSLVEVVKRHPHFERRGNRKVFYPEHVETLREVLQCPALKQNAGKASSTLSGPLPVNAFEKALALATQKSRRNSVHNTKPSSGNVVRMAKRRFGPSRRLS